MKPLRILVTTIGGLTSPDCLLALRHNGEREVFIVGCDAFSGACGRVFVDSIHRLGYPHKNLVIKPRFGRGGKRAYILSDLSRNKELFSIKPSNEMPLSFFESALKDQKNKNDADELIIMEYLREPFISAYSLCNKAQNIITMEHIREWGNASQTSIEDM